MNVTQKGILILLKSAVTESALTLPEGFELEEAFQQIRRHHITALAYDGAVRCGVARNHPVMGQLFTLYCKELQKSERQLRMLQRVQAAFEEQGIDYMPLKGCNMKPRYPKPELRSMGDADILIRVEQYDRIVPIVEQLGFQPETESDHELIWRHPSLYLELHKRLIPSYNRDFYGYFGDGWKLGTCRQRCRISMMPEDEFLYLFTHFAKHYRDGGIGCRHVLDLWVFLRKNPQLQMGYVEQELRKLQLLEFYGNIRRLLQVWFEEGASDDKTEFLTEFIFASGSWGQLESHVLSQAVKHAKHSLAKGNGRLTYLLRMLFPDRQSMTQLYPVLKKAPILLPGAWLVRFTDRVILNHANWDSHEKQLSYLDQDKLEDQQRLLQYVGLDFRF